jgi:hypothetical protein
MIKTAPPNGDDLGRELEHRTQEAIADLKNAEEVFLTASRQDVTEHDYLDEEERRKITAEQERQGRAELEAAIASAEALLDEIDHLLGSASKRVSESSMGASQTMGLVSKAHDVIFQGSAAEEGFLEGLALLLDQAIAAARQLLGMPTDRRDKGSSFTDRMSRMAQSLLGLQQRQPGGLLPQPPGSFGGPQRFVAAQHQRNPERLTLPALTPEKPAPEPAKPPESTPHPGCPLCASKGPASHNSEKPAKDPAQPTTAAHATKRRQASKPGKSRSQGRDACSSASPSSNHSKRESRDRKKTKKGAKQQAKDSKVPPAFALPFPAMAPMAPAPAMPLPPPRPIPAVPPGFPSPGPAAPLIGGPPAFSLKG